MTWRRRTILAGAAACTVELPSMSAFAQPRNDLPLVGILQLGAAEPLAGWVEAVRRGLAQYGLVDGKTMRLAIRHADNDTRRLVGLARELAALGSRVIVTQGTTSVRAAQSGAPAVPIVMAPSADPVGAGFARSLARPGGNITGIGTIGPEIIGKRIEILKEALPAARSFAALLQAANPANARWRPVLDDAGRALGVRIHVREVSASGDFAAAFDWAADLKVDGVFLISDPMFDANIDAIASLALARRLPTIAGGTGSLSRAGALLSYAQEIDAILNRAGYYVAEILRGVDPGTLPIEQPTVFRLAINMRTARALGLTIPPSLLARADEVIE